MLALKRSTTKIDAENWPHEKFLVTIVFDLKIFTHSKTQKISLLTLWIILSSVKMCMNFQKSFDNNSSWSTLFEISYITYISTNIQNFKFSLHMLILNHRLNSNTHGKRNQDANFSSWIYCFERHQENFWSFVYILSPNSNFGIFASNSYFCFITGWIYIYVRITEVVQ